MITVRVGLVGDHDRSVIAHQAIPLALALAGTVNGVTVEGEWLPTDSITTVEPLRPFHALWCVPASPYRSMDGALRAIRFAREQPVPFLGTCGGFQHAVIEYARTVLGWDDAEHGETAPDATRAVITPLVCTLVEQSETLRLEPGSKLAAAYGALEACEGYHCSYGVNEGFRSPLTAGALRIAAQDASGAVRAVELQAHPFFVATLFQPERRALQGEAPPIVAAFVASAAGMVHEAM